MVCFSIFPDPQVLKMVDSWVFPDSQVTEIVDSSVFPDSQVIRMTGSSVFPDSQVKKHILSPKMTYCSVTLGSNLPGEIYMPDCLVTFARWDVGWLSIGQVTSAARDRSHSSAARGNYRCTSDAVTWPMGSHRSGYFCARCDPSPRWLGSSDTQSTTV